MQRFCSFKMGKEQQQWSVQNELAPQQQEQPQQVTPTKVTPTKLPASRSKSAATGAFGKNKGNRSKSWR